VPNNKSNKLKCRKPETVRVITKDLIRDVVVPSEDHTNSIILNFSEYSKIKQKARDTHVADEQTKQQSQQLYEKKQEEMRARKQLFNEIDAKRSEKCGTSDLEAESRTIAAEMIKRSQQFVKLLLCEILLSKELILEAKLLIKLTSEAEFSLVVVMVFKLVLLCAANLRLRIFKIAAKAGSKEKLNIK
jgi:hypothetical protein